MKKIIKFLVSGVVLFFVLTSGTLANTPRKIRLALFDNPQPDPSKNETASQFVNSYLAGINTAITVAASKGVYITEK